MTSKSDSSAFRGERGRLSQARLFLLAQGLWIAFLFGAAFYGTASGILAGQIRVETVSFDALAGWQEDDPVPAFTAFLRSCDRINKAPPARPMGRSIRSEKLQQLYGRVSDWQEVCAVADLVDGTNGQDIRAYFESFFVPVRIYQQGARTGLLTGYYEPQLQGSRTPDARHHVPLLKRPDDLVSVDLGQFRDDLKGKRLAGRVAGHRLVPYETRAALEAATPAPGGVLVWVDDAIDAFILHIQGSGRVVLEGGTVMRVGYAAGNGHPYTAIGKILIDRGAIARENMSMQAIRAWLEAHPAEAGKVMNANASFVFFQELDPGDPELGPLGAEGLPLTRERSIAVDRSFHALGAPVWVEGTAPQPRGGDGHFADTPFARLMVMQDTGGAIRGVMRADIFWGTGSAAEAVAGRMKHQGRFVVLIPKRLALPPAMAPEAS